jgi:hypothetical protein
MSADVKVIELDDAKPGMVLAHELTDAHGSVLLPAQASLTESMLSALGRRGISTISIVHEIDEDDEAREQRRQLQRAHAQARLVSLFRKYGTDGANGKLHALVERFRMEQTS